MKNKLSILFFHFALSIYGEYICNHRLPDIKELVNGIQIDELPPHHREKRAAISNLRIHFDYQSSFINASNSDTFIKNIMEPTRDRLQKVLLPNAPTVGVLRVDRNCISNMYRVNSNRTRGCTYGCETTTKCLGVVVPDMYLKQCVEIHNNGTIIYSGTEGTGIANVDIVILVTYVPCAGTALGYAASCFMESTLDRPILGVMNFCSNVINLGNYFKTYLNIITHELIHALGFSVEKYAFFRYSNGTPIVPRTIFGWPNLGLSDDKSYYKWNDQIIKQFTRKRTSYTRSFQSFVLPNVLEAARNHFNCSSLEGVDLEDYGGAGSTLSHFDEYLLQNEMMTPQTDEEHDIFSNITLSLLKDTGWYSVDYSNIEDLDYGYKKGCLLPEEGCYTYMKSHKSNLEPFCNKTLSYGKSLTCASSKKYYYLCSLKRYSSVDPKYQYFQSLEGVDNNFAPFYAGLSPFNEYCPVHLVVNNPSFLCDKEWNNNLYNRYNIVPSYYGANSMCFTNDVFGASQPDFYGASCQKYEMTVFPNNLTIFVGSMSFNCPSSKTHSYFLRDGKKVIIRCPDDFRTTVFQTSSSRDGKILINLFIIILFYFDYIFEDISIN